MIRAQPQTNLPTWSIRAAWMLFAALCVSLILAGAGPYARLAITPCTGDRCLAVQVSPAAMRVLVRLGGIDTGDGRVSATIALLSAVLCLLTAGLCIWRRPHDFAAVAAAWGLTALAAGEFTRALGLAEPFLWHAADALSIVALVGLGFAFCALADGRPVPRWTFWAVTGCGVAAATVTAAASLMPDSGWAPATVILLFAGVGTLLVCALSLAFQQRAAGSERMRERISWAIAALALLSGALLIGRPFHLLALPTLPLDALPVQAYAIVRVNAFALTIAGVGCMATALLRDEIFDVEVIVNRAIVYGLMSMAVLAAYVLVVGYLSLLFQNSARPLVALIATGAVALVFQPLRERIQGLVDQLLYGARAQPYAVVTAVGRRLESTGAPEEVLPAVVETVAGALRFAYVAIVLGEGAGETVVAAHGKATDRTPEVFPLSYQGEAIGRLQVEPRDGESGLTDADRRLLTDLARQAGVAARAVQLTHDLRRSREQIVVAREEERRRLRRDLHDGLGPTLASQALTIDTAELLLESDPATAAALLRTAKLQAQSAVSDIRRVVYGLRPPALDDLGLVNALREQASRFNAGGIDVRVESAGGLPPLPAAVEVAAFQIVQEALANVARHSQACRCVVKVAAADSLTLTVSDNGVGMAEGRAPGVGLQSMRERAEELGGVLRIKSIANQGTTVRATLPLALATQSSANGNHK